MLVSAFLVRKLSSAKIRILAAILLVMLIIAAPLVAKLVDGSVQDYSHVLELMSAKIQFLGKMPQDPNQLSLPWNLSLSRRRTNEKEKRSQSPLKKNRKISFHCDKQQELENIALLKVH
jgi:hypothetical protein